MAQEYELTPITPIRRLQREIIAVRQKQKESEEAILKKLVDSNLNTQQNVSDVISELKELVKEVKGEDEKDLMEKTVSLNTINKKVKRLEEQNQLLISAVNELIQTIRTSVVKKPLPPPPLPPSNLSTMQLTYKRTKEV